MLLVEPLNYKKSLEKVSDKENQQYIKSDEWKYELYRGAHENNSNYTTIYRDKDGTIKEGWHYLSKNDVEWIIEKYAHQKKELLFFDLATLAYGERLKTFTGNSKN